jgi:hypothetical protein
MKITVHIRIFYAPIETDNETIEYFDRHGRYELEVESIRNQSDIDLVFNRIAEQIGDEAVRDYFCRQEKYLSKTIGPENEYSILLGAYLSPPGLSTVLKGPLADQ